VSFWFRRTMAGAGPFFAGFFVPGLAIVLATPLVN
jgi:hypothetical protein